MKKKFSTLLLTSSAILTLSCLTLANSTVSPDKTFSVGSHSFVNNASMDAYPDFIQSTVWISTDEVMPTSYMGASAYCFDIYDNLCQVTPMIYNSSPTSGVGVYTDYFSGNGTFYAAGHTTVFNGSNYVNQNTYSSPYASTSRAKALKNFEKALENNGMVKAVGIDGTRGYVYASDLKEEQPKNPEEAIQKQKSRGNSSKFINLYDESGKNIIGKFEISVGNIKLK